MRITNQGALLAAACLLVLSACGKSTPPPAEAAAPSAKPFNAASIFPEGPGRELVLNTCGSCHSLVCAARGQRTAARWESLRVDHKEKLTATNSADLNSMFSYLSANFNDTKAEPQVPAELLQQGCTPF